LIANHTIIGGTLAALGFVFVLLGIVGKQKRGKETGPEQGYWLRSLVAGGFFVLLGLFWFFA
jgi:hypothetical protein